MKKYSIMILFLLIISLVVIGCSKSDEDLPPEPGAPGTVASTSRALSGHATAGASANLYAAGDDITVAGTSFTKGADVEFRADKDDFYYKTGYWAYDGGTWNKFSYTSLDGSAPKGNWYKAAIKGSFKVSKVKKAYVVVYGCKRKIDEATQRKTWDCHENKWMLKEIPISCATSSDCSSGELCDSGECIAAPTGPGEFSGIDTLKLYSVGANGLIAKSDDKGESWVVVTPTTGAIDTRTTFVGVSCPSNMICHTVAEKSLGYKTTDGGVTWSGTNGLPGNAAPESVRGVYCADANTCWLYGSAGYIAKWNPAADPSQTQWVKQASATSNVEFVAFTCMPDKQSCFAVGGGYISRTTNGGTTWQGNQFSIPKPAGISCPALTTCYMANGDGAVYKGNGVQMPSVRADEVGVKKQSALACFDISTCMTVGSKTDAITGVRTIAVWKTTDAGVSWTDLAASSAENDFLAALYCYDKDNCYALGENGLNVYKITAAADGSTSVTKHPYGEGGSLKRIAGGS